MASTAALYSPELLGLAMQLADVPPQPDYALHGAARSQSCGSTLDIDLECVASGRVREIGMLVKACAVGQAAAAIFASAAEGRTLTELEGAKAQIERWLSGEGGQPTWPGFDPLVPARAYPGRHGALLLPWRAAIEALSSASARG